MRLEKKAAGRVFLSFFVSLALITVAAFTAPREAGAWATTTAGPYGLKYAYTEGAFFQFYSVHPLLVGKYGGDEWPNSSQMVDLPEEDRFAPDMLFAPIDYSTGGLDIGAGYGFMHPAAVPEDLKTWLEALEWPETGGYYNVTDAGENQGSIAVRDIFYHNYYGTYFKAASNPTSASATSPLDMGDSGSGTQWVAAINDGEYDFTPVYYHESLPEIGENPQFIYLYSFTKEGAIGFLHRMYQSFSGGLQFLMPDGGCEFKMVAFTADLSVASVAAGTPGSDGMAAYGVVIENLSPFEAHNALFELYAWPDGASFPTLVASKTVSVPRASVAKGTPGAVTLTGFFAAPVGEDFRLIATINAPYSASGSVLGSNPGRWSGQPYKPLYEDSVPPGMTAFMEYYYDNNVKATSLISGSPEDDSSGGGGSSSGGSSGSSGSGDEEEEEEGEGDLIARSVILYSSSGSQMAGALTASTEYTVKASFRSTFDVGGYAQLRLYRKDTGCSLSDSKYAYFEPGGSLTWTTKVTSGTVGTKTFIATVNLFYDDGEWNPGKFRVAADQGLVEETTYDNNKVEETYAVNENTEPSTESNYAEYYPYVKKLVPRYRTETRWIWVPEVKKVPVYFNKSQPKIRVRLIPFTGEGE
ncbi:hypothetical protein E308F_25610 [Moorella sp. E308F]|uniref:hypothetical protein n=1 Tax=Moorella sp. E308F TaxID=2572682 RepID=UPI0010FFACA1|nr:hypothetical protein [Moorella sp. E308F]GEA16317.1 hypothetical protein E308F_25610 [Moorella sp. E308F]